MKEGADSVKSNGMELGKGNFVLLHFLEYLPWMPTKEKMETGKGIGGLPAKETVPTATLTSVPMHMFEVKDYKSREAAAAIYHHRERLTGKMHASKATQKDYDDYICEIRV